MRLNDNYILRDIAGEKIIVKQGKHGVDMTRIISLNSTATVLWEEFRNKEFTAEDAAQFLVSRYGISVETATKDAGLWIGKLKDCGAIIE